MAQQQQQLQQLDALAKQLQQEKDAKVVENQTKKEIAAAQEETKKAIAMAQEETKRLQLINQRQIAEITTKAQDARERQKLDAELDSDLHVAAHEVALQKDQQAHDAQQAATQQAHEAEMGQQGHEQALEQGDAGSKQSGSTGATGRRAAAGRWRECLSAKPARRKSLLARRSSAKGTMRTERWFYITLLSVKTGTRKQRVAGRL
jgi:hypothetical protein